MRNIGSGQSPLRNLVFSHEHHAFLLLGISDKVLEELNASGNARYAIMRANRHHPTTGGSFRVEDIKIILQVLQVRSVSRGRRIVRASQGTSDQEVERDC